MSLRYLSNKIVFEAEFLCTFLVQEPFGALISFIVIQAINLWGKSHNIVFGVNLLTLLNAIVFLYC
jgi:hypothetical protein